jgi:uncharacterized protein
MRALFAILFGASMALFIDQAEARGTDGDTLQAKRLAWLAVFGVAHYVVLWWGDILFAYAACGLILLLFHRLPERLLASGAAALFIVLHVQGTLATMPLVNAEEALRLGAADPEQTRSVTQYYAYLSYTAKHEVQQYIGGFWSIMTIKMRDHPFWLLAGVVDGFGEFLPLMTLGLILQRRGFFAGNWPRRLMLPLGLGASIAGFIVTMATLAWLWPRHFPPIAMDALLRYDLALPHTLTAIGYATLLVLAAPKLAATTLGIRIAAAGRMAFSNYLGTSLVMTAIFYGWGLGLFGQFGALLQWPFVLFGWGLMLWWSKPWLAHWQRGPLEWLWRMLVARQVLPNRR